MRVTGGIRKGVRRDPEAPGAVGVAERAGCVGVRVALARDVVDRVVRTDLRNGDRPLAEDEVGSGRGREIVRASVLTGLRRGMSDEPS